MSVWWAVTDFVLLPIKKKEGKKWEWQDVRFLSIAQYQNSYVDKLALHAGVGVSRMPLCVGGTEKGKRRKGSPPLLLGSADAFAILSGRHDQTLGERRFGSWPTKKAVLCLVSVCVCVRSWAGRTVYVGWCEIVHPRLPACRCALPKIADANKMFSLFTPCLMSFIDSKNNTLSEASKRLPAPCLTFC